MAETNGWVQNPKNPVEWTYTDEDGVVHTAYQENPEVPEAVYKPEEQRDWVSTKPTGFVDTFLNYGTEAVADPASAAGFVRRKYNDWTDSKVPYLKEKYPGQTDEWYEKTSDSMIGVDQRREYADRSRAVSQNPAWRPDESAASNLFSSRGPAALLGMISGSAGPEMLIPELKAGSGLLNAGARILMGAGSNAAADAGYQGLAVSDNAQGEFDMNRLAGAAILGGVFQGGVEGVRAGAKALRGESANGPVKLPDSGLEVKTTTLSPEVEAEYAAMQKTGTADEIISFLEQNGGKVNKAEMRRWVAMRDAGRQVDYGVSYKGENGAPDTVSPVSYGKDPLENKLADEANAFIQSKQDKADGVVPEGRADPDFMPAKKAPAFKPSNARVNEAQDWAVSEINHVASDWKNAPEYEVHADFSKNPEFDPDSIGVYDSETGKVHINMKNIPDKATLHAAMFHEGLGHHGMLSRFDTDLDVTLNKIYDNNDTVRKETDEWIANNPDAYADDVDPLARAVEEILAGKSEAGRIPSGVMDELRQTVKESVRRMGLDLAVSDREVSRILGMAHNATVNGKKGDVRGNGFRYMYVGANGWNTTYADMKDTWKRLEAGEDPDTVRRDTGYFVGPEKGIRREINDADAVFDDDLFSKMSPDDEKTLGELLSHDKLFEEYPHLRDLPVTRKSDLFDWSQSVQGWATNKGINITPYSSEATRTETVLHEIQHMIQTYEGWAEGNNTKNIIKGLKESQQDVYRDKALKDISKQLKEFDELSDAIDRLYRSDKARQLSKEIEALEKVLQDFRAGEPDQMLNFDNPEHKIAYNRKGEISGKLREELFGVPKYSQLTKKQKSFDAAVAYRGVNQAVLDFTEEAEEVLADYTKIQKAAYGDELQKALNDREESFRAYENTFGEIEARDTAARRYLDDVQRKQIQPYSISDDVPTRDISVLRHGRPVSESTPKYMKKRHVGSGSEGPLQGGSRRDGTVHAAGPIRSMNLSVEEILNEAAPERQAESWNEWIEDVGKIRDKAKAASKLTSGSEAPDILAARLAIGLSANRIADLSRKAVDGTLTPRQEFLLSAEILRNASMQEAVAKTVGNAGRILNSMKITVETDEAFSGTIRNMMKNQDMGVVLADPASRQKVFSMLAEASDHQAVSRLSKDIFDPKALDYVFSGWYGIGLLSRPSTQVNNLIGTAENILTELPRLGMAAIYGLPRGIFNKDADRVLVNEVIARGVGMGMGVIQGVKNMPKAFAEGRPQTRGVKENEDFPSISQYWKDKAAKEGRSVASVLGRTYGVTTEFAGKMMSATDELFRSMAALSEIHGESIRHAYKEGGGENLWARAEEYRKNAPDSLVEQAAEYARKMTYRDEPSAIARNIQHMLVSRPDDNKAETTAKFLTRLQVPFIVTPDSIIRTVVRDVPILGFLDRYNRADWASGPRGRDLVKGRMSVGLGLGLFALSLAADGTLTGEGPSNPQKKQELEATGWRANSVRQEDGSYFSIDNYGPASTYMRAVATLAERAKENELDKKSYIEASTNLLFGFTKAIADNTWTEGLFDTIGAFSEDGSRSPVNNLVAGTASSLATPGIIQAGNQAFVDPVRRSTVGDGSLEDRTTGRIASAYPGLSDDLPAKHDVYGRVSSRPGGMLQFLIGDRISNEDQSDPTIQELNRLSQKFPGTVIGLPKKDKGMNDATYEYIKMVSGQWTVEELRNEVGTEEWNAMPDNEKVKLVKKTASAQRREVKRLLSEMSE